MAGLTELSEIIKSMSPELMDGEYVFCSVQGTISQYTHLNPIATFRESEGLTLLVRKPAAEHAHLEFESSYRQITLNVHSSLDSVGLTAAVAGALAEKGISANVIAAYYHDHIFVSSDDAQIALDTLHALAQGK
ncbi:ACT domain-containing protein [Vibrio sonorensis]|uniref:ACT domain-containing protein n=1 Tax=Vibrio sonorensis TaxID=1004316 RepID=UPI0008D963FC|nr:ACT domain-containing protein [Vibrio sonorensis]